MKHMKLMTIAVLTAALLGLTACHSGEETKEPETSSVSSGAESSEPTEESSAESSEESSAESSENTEAAAPAVLDVRMAEGPTPLGENTFIEEGMEESEYLSMVLIDTDQPIHDVQFLAISVADADAERSFNVDEVLHEWEELTPGTTLTIGMEFADMPTRGLSYVNADGETVQCYFAQSGEDGSLLFNQF